MIIALNHFLWQDKPVAMQSMQAKIYKERIDRDTSYTM